MADKVAADYPKIKDTNRRLLTILRTPRMGILVNAPGIWDPITMTGGGEVTTVDSFDHNDKNWWCPFEPDRQLGGLRDDFDLLTGMQRAAWSAKRLEPVVEADAIATLAKKRESVLKAHPVVKSVNWKEIRTLSGMPSAPKLLATAATRWGKAAAKDDTAAAEALALAIRSTRYGCNWHGGHGADRMQEILCPGSRNLQIGRTGVQITSRSTTDRSPWRAAGGNLLLEGLVSLGFLRCETLSLKATAAMPSPAAAIRRGRPSPSRQGCRRRPTTRWSAAAPATAPAPWDPPPR